MERVVLGKTGIKVTRLGFGGIPIQRVDEQQAVETVLHAVNKGVEFIDTSRAYTTSEERIGLALEQSNKRIVVATKSFNRTSDGIRSDIEKSLKDLKREYLDLYQCHFVRDDDDYNTVISTGGALEGLHKAREEGLIGSIGITSHSLDLLSRVIDDGLFDTIMACYSFLEPLAEERVIPRAIEKDIGVIAMKPFSGGVVDNARLALKYVLSKPKILVIPGVESKELFDENWEIFLGGYEISDSEKQEIEDIRDRYGKIFCRRCDYCQPCSEDIPIQIVLGLRSMVKRMGEGFLQGEWATQAIEKARECSECEDCMSRCPYGLSIPELLKENIQWVDEQT